MSEPTATAKFEDLPLESVLIVLREICDRKEYQEGWILHTLDELYSTKDFTIEQWQAVAVTYRKPQSWAFQQHERFN